MGKPRPHGGTCGTWSRTKPRQETDKHWADSWAGDEPHHRPPAGGVELAAAHGRVEDGRLLPGATSTVRALLHLHGEIWSAGILDKHG